MNPLRALYRRLDIAQRQRWFKIAASVIAVALCVLYFGWVASESRDLKQQRIALENVLFGQNLQKRDEVAVQFRERGEVVVNNRTYGGESFRRRADLFFTPEGFFQSPRALAGELLLDQKSRRAPIFLLDDPATTLLIGAVTLAWLLLIIWTDITLPFLLVLIGTAVPAFILRDPLGWFWTEPKKEAMLAVAGIGLLSFTYVLLTRVALLLLGYPTQALAVAHTVVKEASRLRISLVFIIALLVILPAIPMFLNPEDPLRFRVQTFISRSVGLTFALAACMTLVLSCASVAFEIRDRQIWQLMSKPVSRISYLFGKWLGIMSINAVLLIISGVSIFIYIQFLKGLPTAPGIEGQLDRLSVNDEVLTARIAVRPTYDRLTPDQMRQRVDDRINNDPELRVLDEVPPALRRDLARQINDEYLLRQRLIPPAQPDQGQVQNNSRTYRFEGLGAARHVQSAITLRYKFHILRSDEHEQYPVVFVFNDDPNQYVAKSYVPAITHTLPIAPDMIREDGTMNVTIVNTYVPLEGEYRMAQGAINFDEEKFELLHKVGEFPGNFVRAMLINWVKLAFLAMIGIAASTFLSFPVACLLSFTIFLGGALAPFVAYSLEEFYPPTAEQMDWSNIGMVLFWFIKTVIRNVAIATVWLVGGFGDFRPTQALVEGKFIPWTGWGGVLGAMFKLGLLWCGLALAFGWLLFRKRELATYSGQG
jgi:hypothetical protein